MNWKILLIVCLLAIAAWIVLRGCDQGADQGPTRPDPLMEILNQTERNEAGAKDI